MKSPSSLICLLLLAGACLPVLASDASDLCETHDWFQLRERAHSGKISLLCKGAVDASFEDRAAAERELNALIRRMPRSASSYRAHEILSMMYFREGRYRKAAAQLDQMLAAKPDAEDAKAMQSLFSVLARYPDQTVVSAEPSTLRSETIDDNLFIPVRAGEVTGSYIVDTGANLSAISESEARRLGLKLEDTSTKPGDISGSGSPVRVAEAEDLWIGKTHLKNVAFLVYPDGNEPFVDEPEGHKGVLGIQVLIALGSIRVGRENRVDMLAAPVPAKIIPLAFDAAMPVTVMGLNGKALDFTFDTGASTTYLGPVFAGAFPDLMRAARKKDQKLMGVSGSTTQDSSELPSVRFSLGKEIELKPATVMLQPSFMNSEWSMGNLGYDLISQAIPITIDFRAMQLRVEDR
jgi:hypothetical protein